MKLLQYALVAAAAIVLLLMAVSAHAHPPYSRAPAVAPQPQYQAQPGQATVWEPRTVPGTWYFPQPAASRGTFSGPRFRTPLRSAFYFLLGGRRAPRVQPQQPFFVPNMAPNARQPALSPPANVPREGPPTITAPDVET